MDERDLSIEEAEQSYIDDLNTLEDWYKKRGSAVQSLSLFIMQRRLIVLPSR